MNPGEQVTRLQAEIQELRQTVRELEREAGYYQERCRLLEEGNAPAPEPLKDAKIIPMHPANVAAAELGI